MNVDKELTANQKKFLDKIEADYILLKFGSYGQAYASAVADRNPRLYKKMLSKPDYRQFIADKDKHYRHEISTKIAVIADKSPFSDGLLRTNKEAWYDIMFRFKAQATPFINNLIIADSAKYTG